MKRDPATRVGKNAPTEDETRMIAMYDTVRALLFQRATSAECIAEAVGVPVGRINALRSNLGAYSLGQRQAAQALLMKVFAYAQQVLAGPDQGSTAGCITVGQHLRTELKRLQRRRGGAA